MSRFCSQLSLLGFISALFINLATAQVATTAVITERATLRLNTLADGLDHPWGLTFINPATLVVSERSGQLRLLQDGKLSPPVKGLPAIDAKGQGGLLDVLYQDEWLYFSYAEPDGKGNNSTAVARAKLKQLELTEFQVLFRQLPKVKSQAHFGSRLVLAPSGHLFITLGERYQPRDEAQNLNNHLGKIVRIWPDGRVPKDNPFSANKNAKPEIWSFGHRNVQGATLHPKSGQLWTHEHGPRGGDEINPITAGKNYGWPVVTYGEEYFGGKIGVGTEQPGMEQPLYYWVPSIAPSGMTFYTGKRYPGWQGNLFIGSLKFRQLVRLELKEERIVAEERLFQQAIGERIRQVVQGPDDLLYLLTDSDNGKIIRLEPATASQSRAPNNHRAEHSGAQKTQPARP